MKKEIGAKKHLYFGRFYRILSRFYAKETVIMYVNFFGISGYKRVKIGFFYAKETVIINVNFFVFFRPVFSGPNIPQ